MHKIHLFSYLLILAAVLSFATSCSENDGPDFPKRDYELNPKLTKTLHKRALYDEKVDDLLNLWVYQYVFEYTSVGPDMKTPVRLTGVITMNPAVYNREVEPKDLMLYNEFTTAKHGERTSEDEFQDLALYMNKLHNGIAISADLYGWTLTEDKPQAYCCTHITAQETMDCWDAAMEILKDLNYNVEGLPIYNVGYSSGALDAMAMQRYVDAYRPDIEFKATMVGGGPYDLEAIYKNYVETDTTGYICALPLMIVAYKETFNMPFDYKDIFKEPLASNIQPWILSKDYGTWDINGLIGTEKHISEVLTPEACNLNSPLSQMIIKKFRENSVCGTGQTWQPNTKTKYFVYHSTADSYITHEVGIEMADYLKAKGCDVTTDFKDDGDHVRNGILYFTAECLLIMAGQKFEIPEGTVIDY